MRLYTHHDLIVLIHPRSRTVAKAERAFVACATPEEMRTAFPTQFASLITSPNHGEIRGSERIFVPQGWEILVPSLEEQAWRDAVGLLLDETISLSEEDLRHVDLQLAWRTGKAPVVEPYESDANFWARLHRSRGTIPA